MSAELKDKSISEILVTSTDIIRKYRIMFNKILGSTPEESRETQEALEGFTPAEIREALKLYRRHDRILGSTPDEDLDTRIITSGFTQMEVKEALRLYRIRHPKNR